MKEVEKRHSLNEGEGPGDVREEGNRGCTGGRNDRTWYSTQSRSD